MLFSDRPRRLIFVLVLQATMWPMPIVAMEPVRQFGQALIRVVIGLSVLRPFAPCCLYKARGLWSVGW
jgi:hypothetical protein